MAAYAESTVLSIGNASVTEGDSGTTTAQFSVGLSAASDFTVQVHSATANGTATAGSDYSAASGTLTFAPGETSKPLDISVDGDTLVEPNETFTVTLDTPSASTRAGG